MNLKTALIISLAANLVLLGLLYQHRQKPSAPAAAAASSHVPAKNVRRRPMEQTAPTPAAAAAQAFDWQMVESPDYKRYIANLRAIGCPEETIRDIIKADVNKLFEARRKQISGANTNKFQFWKTGNIFASMVDEKKVEQQQQLSQEKRALLKTLLGDGYEEKLDITAALNGMNPFETLLDFLPGDKQTQLLELEQKYGAKMMKGMKGGAPDAQDLERIKDLQQQKSAELARLLSPEEKEQYDLRMSQTAMMMRMQLNGFDPSEQEFRDIFALRKTFDDEYSVMGMPAMADKETRRQREEAQTQLNQQIKELLGDQRYAEYERVQDPAYQSVARVAERQGLAQETAVQVYDMKKIAEQQASAVRNNASFTPDQRQQALAAIRSETERSIGQVLGAEGLDAYKDVNGTYWLNNISPAAPPTPANVR